MTYWRELPSMAVVRDGEMTYKAALGPRFQEAIDEAAMRLGDVDSEAYLQGWRRSAWAPVEGGSADGAVERVVAALEGQWDQDRLAGYLDDLGPAAS